MSCMGGPHGSRYCVTIVGDPDQSIYGWRSAEIGNLSLMEEEFNKGRRALLGDNNALGVQKAFLEENYRSTGKILEAAKGIIEGDPNRIERDLFTSHPYGLEVRLKLHSSAQVEAAFVATEIKRLVAYTGGLLNYDDFAILLRFNALSREVERQLQQENIPSRMMGGARFFERKEVKDILAYLTLADNPDFTPALERVINVPKRSIGEKTVEDLKKVADSEGIRTMRIVRKVAKSDVPIYGVRKSTQIKLKEFIQVVDELRRMAKQDQPVSEIIETLLQRIKYKEYLQKEHDFDQRWENVKELINFSALVAQSSQDAAAYDRVLEQHVDNARTSDLEVDDEELDDAFVHDSPIKRETPGVSDSVSRYGGGMKSLGSSSTLKGKAKIKDEEVAVIDLASSDEDTSPSKKRQRHKNVGADDEASRVKKTKTKKSSSATSSPGKRDDRDKAGKDKALEKTSTLHQFLEASLNIPSSSSSLSSQAPIRSFAPRQRRRSTKRSVACTWPPPVPKQLFISPTRRAAWSTAKLCPKHFHPSSHGLQTPNRSRVAHGKGTIAPRCCNRVASLAQHPALCRAKLRRQSMSLASILQRTDPPSIPG
ncbi:UvrD-helicase-domain-containing protein [Acaromyces ingoldii]|uniref:DNA 3'-5' helicase n=1 Tax=Acaromyces ingoldii TaxID=215250 RepID=A0A316YXC8_9BASI|nr:UvrD-helicase-domain-containing protein [Acaromyces ingoldii]PWN93706.1 UvrD-helicase-domain-containing protein [Acaromyces ingoldii]